MLLDHEGSQARWIPTDQHGKPKGLEGGNGWMSLENVYKKKHPGLKNEYILLIIYIHVLYLFLQYLYRYNIDIT